jgi:hypothetical protein
MPVDHVTDDAVAYFDLDLGVASLIKHNGGVR